MIFVDKLQMTLLDIKWENGDVGNWLLKIGKANNVAHIYKNPWSPLWVLDIKATGYSESFTLLEDAKQIAETKVRYWITDLLYCSPDDDMIYYGDIAANFGC